MIEKELLRAGSEVLFLDLVVVTRVFAFKKFIKANISFVLLYNKKIVKEKVWRVRPVLPKSKYIFSPHRSICKYIHLVSWDDIKVKLL